VTVTHFLRLQIGGGFTAVRGASRRVNRAKECKCTMKNGVFWDETPCDRFKKRRDLISYIKNYGKK
jgi:hypothetical protein